MISNVITRQSINIAKYKAKLELLSDYESNPTRDKLKRIYADPTLFIHKLFKLNGKSLELYPYQDLIINDIHKFIIFRAANQIGKSLLLDAKAARNLLIDHGKAHNEAIVSKSLPQSIFQMRRVKSLLNSMSKVSWKEEKGTADSMSVISVDIKDGQGQIKYTNLLICAPCTEGLLGYDLHSLNLDEFEYWEVDIAHFFNQIAQPRTYSTKGDITIFSNPNGEDSFVAELEKQKLKIGGFKWHVYIFDYLDKPGNTQEDYDQLKFELPRQKFESTVAAIRSISDRNYFTPDEIERSYDPTLTEIDMVGKHPFFFLDVGAKHDQSVLVGGYATEEETVMGMRAIKHIHIPIIHCYPIGYPISMVVGSKTENTGGWHYEKSVKDYLEEYSRTSVQPVFGVDVTGNSGISPLFNSCGINPIDVVFSGPAKSGMYQRFKYFMEKGLLHRIKSKEWDYQARHLEVKKSIRGYLMIHHENESDLDDVMDATAGMIELADSMDYVPVSLTIVRDNDDKRKGFSKEHNRNMHSVTDYRPNRNVQYH